MSVNSKHGAEVWNRRKCQDTSPERTKVWIEPKSKHNHRVERKVAVVYYLSQNGLLEHPHFIEVLLSSPEGLYLRDVITRLNQLRGLGMANMYAWSYKRTYKSGYVWQDLSENDFIYPCHGHEYILKGSRLLESSLSFRFSDTTSLETNSSGDLDHLRFSDILRQSKNRSIASLDDLNLPKRHRARSAAGAKAAHNDAATQTVPVRRHEEVEELSQEEISSPPCSNNSSGELGNPRGQQGFNEKADIRNQLLETERPSGRIKASAVLMQLITCGSKNGEDVVSMPNRE